MSIPKNRVERDQRERKIRATVIASTLILGFIGMLACGYGHAAMSTELYISGVGTVVLTELVPSWGVKYMQDLTPAMCNGAEVGTTSQLMDKRDGSLYWVEKLKDGNCWMTQNLGLVLTTAGLTSELTDLQSNDVANYSTRAGANGETILVWNSSSKFPPRDSTEAAITSSANATNYTAAKSTYGGRDYIMTMPTLVYMKYEYGAISSFGGVKRVSASEGWQPTLSYIETGKIYDETTKTYDAHFLIGGHYQAGAATAGSSNASTSPTNPASSICPKGWRLPSKPSSGDDELAKLIKQYGFTNKTVIDSGNISSAPLYLIRTGSSGGSTFKHIGARGIWITSRMNSQAYMSVLDISDETITIASSVTRDVGRSVRCLLRR